MDWICVKTYSSQLEAELAKGKLEAEGITSHLLHQDMEGFVYAETRGDVGRNLMVYEKDIKKAKKLLNL